jgi:hypothetical protein
MSDPTPPDGWVIDVCATCGALAVYPFRCGHRSETDQWTIAVAVKPTGRSLTALKRAMRLARACAHP